MPVAHSAPPFAATRFFIAWFGLYVGVFAVAIGINVLGLVPQLHPAISLSLFWIGLTGGQSLLLHLFVQHRDRRFAGHWLRASAIGVAVSSLLAVLSILYPVDPLLDRFYIRPIIFGVVISSFQAIVLGRVTRAAWIWAFLCTFLASASQALIYGMMLMCGWVCLGIGISLFALPSAITMTVLLAISTIAARAPASLHEVDNP